MRIEPGCPEDWLQEGGHESGAWDVSTKKTLEALRKWTNRAIGLLLVEQQRPVEGLASSGGIRRKTEYVSALLQAAVEDVRKLG